MSSMAVDTPQRGFARADLIMNIEHSDVRITFQVLGLVGKWYWGLCETKLKFGINCNQQRIETGFNMDENCFT